MIPLLNSLLLTPMLMPDWLDPVKIITSMGNSSLWVVCAILFIECAIFPVLPGDSLLFAVGMFTAATPPIIHFGGMDKWLVYVISCLVMTVFAIGGNVAGYYIGKFVSPWLFRPRDNFFGTIFSQKHLGQTQDFFERYGSKALVLGRFVPFVRTFVTMVAGAAGMTFRHFILWTAVGGVLWVWGVTLLGFLLGTIPLIRDNIDLALLLIVVVSVVPMVIEYLNEKRKTRATLAEAETAAREAEQH